MKRGLGALVLLLSMGLTSCNNVVHKPVKVKEYICDKVDVKLQDRIFVLQDSLDLVNKEVRGEYGDYFRVNIYRSPEAVIYRLGVDNEKLLVDQGIHYTSMPAISDPDMKLHVVIRKEFDEKKLAEEVLATTFESALYGLLLVKKLRKEKGTNAYSVVVNPWYNSKKKTLNMDIRFKFEKYEKPEEKKKEKPKWDYKGPVQV